MSTRAQKGAAGIVIDGRFQDMKEHDELRIGLFARGTIILGSHSFTRSSELDVPVSHSQECLKKEIVKIDPRDIIVSDADGMAASPSHLAKECVNLCDSRWNVNEARRQCISDREDIGPGTQTFRQWALLEWFQAVSLFKNSVMKASTVASGACCIVSNRAFELDASLYMNVLSPKAAQSVSSKATGSGWKSVRPCWPCSVVCTWSTPTACPERLCIG
jgi:hypothetical protein